MATDFGTDAMCLDDMDDMDRNVSGIKVLLQDLTHAVTNARGRMIDAPDNGTDVASWLSSSSTKDTREAAAAALKTECEDDERVATVDVVLTVSREAVGQVIVDVWRVAISGTTVDGQPFRFVVDDFTGVKVALGLEGTNG